MGTGKNVLDHIIWVKNNKDKYKGQWVALKENKLLGHSKSRIKLHNNLKDQGTLSGSLFFLIPEGDL